MTIVELSNSAVVISGSSNGKRSFLLGNNKYVQFADGFDEEQYASAGNQAFQKAYQDENLKALVDPSGVSADQPKVTNSQEVELALPANETSMDAGIKVCFLIAQATGTTVPAGDAITDAFKLDKFGNDKLQFTFTNGGQWPI